MDPASCFGLVSLAHQAQQLVPCHRLASRRAPRLLPARATGRRAELCSMGLTSSYLGCMTRSPKQADVRPKMPSCVGFPCAPRPRGGFSLLMVLSFHGKNHSSERNSPLVVGSFPWRKMLMFYPSLPISTGELHPLHLHHPYLSPEAAFPRCWAQRNQPIFVSLRLFQAYPVFFGKSACLLDSSLLHLVS